MIMQLVSCENHFASSQFINPEGKGTPKQRKQLRKDAIPTLFDVPNPSKSTEGQRHLQRSRREQQLTAVFIKNIDTLFDIFKSRTVSYPKLFKCALKDGSPSFKPLKTMLILFEDLKVLDVKTEPPCMKWWQLSVKDILCLWDDVKSDSHVKYLCARNVDQDCLEIFFCKIRSKGDFYDNPLTLHFIAAHKQSLIESCFPLLEFSNCEKDVNSTLFDFFVEKNVSVFHCPGSDCVDLENDIFCQDLKGLIQ